MRINYPRIPLKEMESGLLVMELHRGIDELYGRASDDGEKVFSAAQLATHLHRDQLRSNRAGMERTPYIEHPLRNTLRLMRWGTTDSDVLAGSLLHDTGEDCYAEIAGRFASGRKYRDMADSGAHAQEVALEWLSDGFGETTGRVVRDLTTPMSVEAMEKGPEKVAAYTRHAVTDIVPNWRSTLVKASDFNDNGGSLRHQIDMRNERSRSGTMRRIGKYRELGSVLIDAIEEHHSTGSIDGRIRNASTRSLAGVLRSFDELERAIGHAEQARTRPASRDQGLSPSIETPELAE